MYCSSAIFLATVEKSQHSVIPMLIKRGCVFLFFQHVQEWKRTIRRCFITHMRLSLGESFRQRFQCRLFGDMAIQCAALNSSKQDFSEITFHRHATFHQNLSTFFHRLSKTSFRRTSGNSCKESEARIAYEARETHFRRGAHQNSSWPCGGRGLARFTGVVMHSDAFPRP